MYDNSVHTDARDVMGCFGFGLCLFERRVLRVAADKGS